MNLPDHMSELELLGWDAGEDRKPIPPRNPQTAMIAHAATNLDVPPLYHATNYVRCRGERLSRVLWRGEQWAVTTFGVECRDGCYTIRKDRLWENEETYSWVLHMSCKGWVDLPDFAEAMRIARHIHAKCGALSS